MNWLYRMFGQATTINITNFNCYCCCSDNTPAPVPPGMPLLGRGETVTMIRFPVTVEPNTVNSDVASTEMIATVDGVVQPTAAVPTNGGSFSLDVAEGSSGSIVSRYVDKAGNPSADSPAATWENASDTTPPAAPAGAPTLGAGETV